MLLSSKRHHARSAKYRIQHIVCTHMAADDEAYGCVQLTEDDARITGIKLKQELVPVAERALRQNMQVCLLLIEVLPDCCASMTAHSEHHKRLAGVSGSTIACRCAAVHLLWTFVVSHMQDLGPLVLPAIEKLKFAASYVLRRLVKSGGVLAGVLPGGLVERQYIPDFKKAFDFFCIHTGGRCAAMCAYTATFRFAASLVYYLRVLFTCLLKHLIPDPQTCSTLATLLARLFQCETTDYVSITAMTNPVSRPSMTCCTCVAVLQGAVASLMRLRSTCG